MEIRFIYKIEEGISCENLRQLEESEKAIYGTVIHMYDKERGLIELLRQKNKT